MISRFKKINQKGYTLIEMAMATVILAVMATTVILSNRYLNLQTVNNGDQVFGTEKAIQMYEELRSLVNGNQQLGVGVLDNYSDNSNYDLVLTTDNNIDTYNALHTVSTGNPGDPVSGNIKSDGYWRYMRQVAVNRVPNDIYARQVTVKVYLYPGKYAANNQTKPGKLLATVGGVVRTSETPYQPSQVMDLYILQINSIPAWWAVLPTLSTAMQTAVYDLESRTPGLFIRPHFITRSSYGRDPLYQPYTNSAANPMETVQIPWAYFYPGYAHQDASPNGCACDATYYDPDSDQNSLELSGQILMDGSSDPVSTSQSINANYSIADQYNNAMRYPDEMVAYQAVTAAAAAATAAGVALNNAAVTEISERMLLEGMLSQPQSFMNSVIVNLHGELLPIPPIRNYSDAAKDPGNQLGAIGVTCHIVPSGSVSGGNTNVRVVTHPELLYYPGATSTSSSVTVRLRVYAYYDSEDTGGVLPPGDPRVPAISLFFPDAAVTVQGVTAIIGNASAPLTYAYSSPAAPYPSGYLGAVPNDATTDTSGPMSFGFQYVGPGNEQSLITLYNTPLRAAQQVIAGLTPQVVGAAFPTNTPTKTPTITSTPTNTPTVTPTATFNPGAGGLNSADVLYGSEYIPCSPDMTTGSTDLSPGTYNSNSYTFTTVDLTSDHYGSNHPKNTARWIISLVMPVTTTVGAAMTIYSGTYAANAIIAGTHAIETRLGAATTASYYVSGGVTTNVYPNLSRTYVWCGDAFMPPYTEQYQFLGDARDCPYLDAKVGGVSIAGAAITIGPNAYNWWFKDGAASVNASMANDGYAGFDAGGDHQAWNGGNKYINADLPRFYQLIRQGLLNTTSIWTTTNGYSFYYYGMGGEIGFDHPPFSTGVSILDYPFLKTTAGSAVNGYDSINGDGKTSGAVTGLWVISRATGSNSVTWYQRSWLGEIYPDSAYNNYWLPYGNLPTVKPAFVAASNPETFYLEPMQSVATPTNGNTSDDGFAAVSFYGNIGPRGCTSFFNGVNVPSAGTTYVFNHDGGGNGTGTEQNLGVTTYSIYPYALPYVVSVQRPWYFGGSGNTYEWSLAPYNTSALRPYLDIPSTMTTGAAVSSRIFYNYSASTTEYGSAVVRMTNINGATTQVGYVVETGTSPSANVGFAALAETCLVYGLRTYLDGGGMAATNKAGHIVQIPSVAIYPYQAVPQYSVTQSISVTIGSPVTYTANGAGVSTGWPVTNIWWRFAGEGNFPNYYTEEYPGYGGALTASGLYQESVTAVYNLKYCSTSDYKWKFVQDGSAAVSGTYDASHAITTTAPWIYNLPVTSASVSLTQGQYLLMAEVYRLNYGENYGFDIYQFNVSW